jgi:hypothetical protein
MVFGPPPPPVDRGLKSMIYIELKEQKLARCSESGRFWVLNLIFFTAFWSSSSFLIAKARDILRLLLN